MASLLAPLAAFPLGLLTGAMLVIAVALVPFWQSIDPLGLSRWFAAHSGRIGRLMVPLGGLAVLTTVLAAVVARAARAPGWPWLAAAALAFACALRAAAR
jgi:hypothetical protein